MRTLMVVHAHPDDEGVQTGGVITMYGDRGVHTVLVTCTNGEMGDDPAGLKPEAEGHDTVATSKVRLKELNQAVEELRVGDLELLGYRDSGMMGWPQNKEPDAFWNVPLEEAIGRVATLMEKHRPEVVITYDENGLYGHPDHIQAHRATIGAAERTGIPQKIYEIAFPKSLMDAAAELQRQQGQERPEPGPNDIPIGTPDELITTHIDVSSVYAEKNRAAFAHQSQMANFDFLKIEEDMLRAWFGTEHFVRRFDKTGAPLPEDDLFAGVL
jgi:LmbE family N-acetylglucosaminyl deacetylase